MADKDKDKIGNQFLEQVERLLAGRTVDSEAIPDDDYRRTLDFARQIAVTRDELHPDFRRRLKARLLARLVEMEEKGRPVTSSWWRRPVWGVVITVVVTAVSLGIMWRTGVFTPLAEPPTTPWAPITPTTPTTPAEPATPSTPSVPAPSETPSIPTAPAEPSAPAPKAFELVELKATPLEDTYAGGGEVAIELTVTNRGPETIKVGPFPPEVTITSPEKGVVLELNAGNEELTVDSGNSETYYFTWNQRDNADNAVASGEYFVTFTAYLRRDELTQPTTFGTEVVIY